MSRHTRGRQRSSGGGKENGHDVLTVQSFIRTLSSVYNTKQRRMLACPIVPANFRWKKFLAPRLDPELSGFSTSHRHSNASKSQEVMHMYVFKNAKGVVSFRYKTQRDINLDGAWRGGTVGIPIFKDGQCPNLRDPDQQPELGGFDAEYMSTKTKPKPTKTKSNPSAAGGGGQPAGGGGGQPAEDNDETSGKGKGQPLKRSLLRHVSQCTSIFDDAAVKEWTELFDEAWPSSHEEWTSLVLKCDKPHEERSALLKLFHVPTLTLPAAHAPVGTDLGAIGEVELPDSDDDDEPPQLITSRLYPRKLQKRDMKAFKAKSIAKIVAVRVPRAALQPAVAPPIKGGATLLIYNEYAKANGDASFRWNPVVVLRRAKAGDRRYDGKKLVATPLTWWLCRYVTEDDAGGGEQLFFRLGKRDFNCDKAGDGWCLDIDVGDEPPTSGDEIMADAHRDDADVGGDDGDGESDDAHENGDGAVEPASVSACAKKVDENHANDGDDESDTSETDEHSDMPLPQTTKEPRKKKGCLIANGALTLGNKRISAEWCLCWVRALFDIDASRSSLLEHASKFGAAMDDAPRTDVAELVQYGTVAGRRALSGRGAEFGRWARWLMNNPGEAWPGDGYPKGVPDFASFCFIKDVAFVVVQRKLPEPNGESLGFYATAYGRQRPMVLTAEEASRFARRKRPQDRLVLLVDYTLSSVNALDVSGLHFECQIDAIAMPAPAPPPPPPPPPPSPGQQQHHHHRSSTMGRLVFVLSFVF